MYLISLQSGIILNIVYNFPNKMAEALGKWTRFFPVHVSATLTLKTWGSQKEEELHKAHITPMVQFIIFTYTKNTILELRSLLQKIFSVLHSWDSLCFGLSKRISRSEKWRDEEMSPDTVIDITGDSFLWFQENNLRQQSVDPLVGTRGLCRVRFQSLRVGQEKSLFFCINFSFPPSMTSNAPNSKNCIREV